MAEGQIQLGLFGFFYGFDRETCGILAPWPGIKPAPPDLEGKVLTTRPSGKSSIGTLCKAAAQRLERVGLVCYSPWGREELDTTWWLNNNRRPEALRLRGQGEGGDPGSWGLVHLAETGMMVDLPGAVGPNWAHTTINHPWRHSLRYKCLGFSRLPHSLQLVPAIGSLRSGLMGSLPIITEQQSRKLEKCL